jgi:hypothetical protein
MLDRRGSVSVCNVCIRCDASITSVVSSTFMCMPLLHPLWPKSFKLAHAMCLVCGRFMKITNHKENTYTLHSTPILTRRQACSLSVMLCLRPLEKVAASASPRCSLGDRLDSRHAFYIIQSSTERWRQEGNGLIHVRCQGCLRRSRP